MVHCVSSSEPDSGDTQIIAENWRVQGITTKEVVIGAPGHHGKTYVESTVTTGIQVGTNVEQGGTHHLTKTDTHHQQADTTHPENIRADSRDRMMEISSPNHSIYSDIVENSPSAEQPDAVRDITSNNSFSETDNPSSNFADHNNYPLLYHNHHHHHHHFIPGGNMYRDQTLLPDHAHYTMVPSNPSLYSNRATSRIYQDDSELGEGLATQAPAHPYQNEKFVESGDGVNVPYFPQNFVNSKIMNVSGSATPGLYPHLYNYRSDINDVAIANYYPSKQAYVDPYFYGQFAYANDEGNEAKDSDSSEEE